MNIIGILLTVGISALCIYLGYGIYCDLKNRKDNKTKKGGKNGDS